MKLSRNILLFTMLFTTEITFTKKIVINSESRLPNLPNEKSPAIRQPQQPRISQPVSNVPSEIRRPNKNPFVGKPPVAMQQSEQLEQPRTNQPVSKTPIQQPRKNPFVDNRPTAPQQPRTSPSVGKTPIQQPQQRKTIPIEKKIFSFNNSFAAYFKHVRALDSKDIFDSFYAFTDDFMELAKNAGDSQMARSLLEAAANLHLPLTGDNAKDAERRIMVQEEIEKTIGEMIRKEISDENLYDTEATSPSAPSAGITAETVVKAVEATTEPTPTFVVKPKNPTPAVVETNPSVVYPFDGFKPLKIAEGYVSIREFSYNLISENSTAILNKLFKADLIYSKSLEFSIIDKQQSNDLLKSLAINIHQQYPEASRNDRIRALVEAIKDYVSGTFQKVNLTELGKAVQKNTN